MGYYKQQIHEGMTVWTADREKLGKNVSLQGNMFVVEKGFFFPKDHTLNFEDISDVRGDDIYLKATKTDITESGALQGQQAADDINRPLAGDDLGRSRASDDLRRDEEIRIPIVEEEISTEKHAREAGSVVIHKGVVTEEEQISVPVTKEKVYVERVETDRPLEAQDKATFEDEEIRVPIMEEQVEVQKRPVVKEEVRVRKTTEQEKRSTSGQVRKEKVDIKEQGEVERLNKDRERRPR
jgi:uncharacterized protein (TIGR02271 family)